MLTQVRSKNKKLWFALDTDAKIVKVFTNKKDCERYVKEWNYESNRRR